MRMIESRGWGNVSELRPTGLLFIYQVIYEYGEPRWNNIDKENSWFVQQSPLEMLQAVI
jgi:hypothetical protein